ncbi:hypothetical protein PILCRDRAFT_17375 [Piloderma croceum F 1598]|uniref:Uncharacterized protein n=1 Tax=Piloderma croceum (strain F 1598) TaxID=765440 RepID=A0A0C3B1L5_PILCF|nr:hypothetical protein PILCRDRAFT_17518 [Piloderma croceum F 1598]KIM71107.1 hypothetical protein PILCRDRAFT_17375 [Piloderma croceum F 1598]
MVNTSLTSQSLSKHTTPIPVISSSTVFVIGHISTSALPNGGILEMWVMHSKDAKPLKIGSHIVIGRSSADLARKDQKVHSLPTAVITGVAYCNEDQVVFRVCISQSHFPSLLSMPLHAARIGMLRKTWHRTQSRWLPHPPPLPQTSGNRRTNHRSEEDW